MASIARKWLPLALLAAAVAASLVVYARLPALVTLPLEGLLPFEVPHPPRPLSRGFAVSLLPALMLLVWIGFRLAPTAAGQRVARRMFRHAPDVVTSPAQFERFAGTYDAIVLGVVLLLLGFHAAILAAALQAPALAVRIVPAVLGASLVLMGNVIPRLRPNWVAGLRSKRILDDPQLWRLTHRVFGTAFVGSGLLTTLVGLLAPRYGLLTGIATLLLSCLVGWVASTRRGGAGTRAAVVVVGMLCSAAVARAQPPQSATASVGLTAAVARPPAQPSRGVLGRRLSSIATVVLGRTFTT